MPDLLRLSGLLILVVGLALRVRTTVVVVAAGLATGLLAGLPLLTDPLTQKEGVIELLGRAFADNRLMSLFIVTLPAIGLCEKHGLQEEAAAFVHRLRAATAGRLLTVYQLLRVGMGVLGIRLNGHPSFVRPLVYPMAQAAAPDGADPEAVKAASAAAENYGNFYGQNLSPVLPGVLLVYGVLKGLGQETSVWRLAWCAIPITAISVVLGAIQFARLDRALERAASEEPATEAE